MTPYLQSIINEILSLDPYRIVKVDLDGFDPYTYFEFPDSIRKKLDRLTEDEDNDFCEWECKKLSDLRRDGLNCWK